jgi:ammonia channel protein AmtB
MNKITKGFVAGVIGALILAAIMFLMFSVNLGGAPGFVGIHRKMFGESVPIDYILGTFGFAVAGGIWGAIYAAVIKNPKVVSGMLYGFVPTLFLWLVISPLMSGALFNGFAAKGLIMPVIFNVVIWGGFVGCFLSRKS